MSEGSMGWRRGQTYSQDLRDRVLAAGQLTARQAAEQFAVSPSYVVKARQRRARTGSVAPRPQKPPVGRKLVHLHAALQDRVDQMPDATLAEHREWLAEIHGVTVGLTTIWKTLSQLKLTLKKSRSGRPSRCGPMSPKRGGFGANCSPSSM
jgi:transposase